MEVSVEPEDSHCRCQIYTQDGTGYITLGDSSHYLMSGGEYFITLRSSSYVGRLSSPTFLVTSLLVGRIIATNKRVECGMVKYDVEIASGIGSFIRMTISDEGIDPVDTVVEEINFRLIASVQKILFALVNLLNLFGCPQLFTGVTWQFIQGHSNKTALIPNVNSPHEL